jgi:hypothetical protein
MTSTRNLHYANSTILAQYTPSQHQNQLLYQDKQVDVVSLLGAYQSLGNRDDAALHVTKMDNHRHVHWFRISDGLVSPNSTLVLYQWDNKTDVVRPSPCRVCTLSTGDGICVLGEPVYLAGDQTSRVVKSSTIELVTEDIVVREKYHNKLISLRNKHLDYSKAVKTSTAATSHSSSSAAAPMSNREQLVIQMKINKIDEGIKDPECKLILSVFKRHYIHHLVTGITTEKIIELMGDNQLEKPDFDRALKVLWNDHPVLYPDEETSSWKLTAL